MSLQRHQPCHCAAPNQHGKTGFPFTASRASLEPVHPFFEHVVGFFLFLWTQHLSWTSPSLRDFLFVVRLRPRLAFHQFLSWHLIVFRHPELLLDPCSWSCTPNHFCSTWNVWFCRTSLCMCFWIYFAWASPISWDSQVSLLFCQSIKQ